MTNGIRDRERTTCIELLEQRRLLSASVSTVMKSDIEFNRDAATSAATAVEGLTPAETKTAYDLTGLTLSNGAAADGSGQTIAIVDAYNDPNIATDLGVFDSEFNMTAPPSLSVVNQTGGSKLPSDDADWDSEISLDVEWAHAIAPGANILLVEANSDDTADLLAAVNYARSAPGVSVVSMSWGGSEFFSFGSGGESESETNYDPDFATPAGHEGVTFVAAAGDSGSQEGVEWPAVSPNVISVGGTSLYTDADGNYQSESGWSGTSGGYSQVEPEPTYQDVVQDSGTRSSPDVAYDADPNTGFAVYDSVADDGYVGWQEVGGTSAGAPQWSAIVAIADQGRVLAGSTTLDGASQTLPTLYSLYTSTDNDYASNFNDVTTGGSGRTHFRFGGYGDQGDQASTGYDTITGLGSPKGASLITQLAGSTVTSTSTGSGTGSGSGTTTVTPTLPASQVQVTVLSNPAVMALAGSAGSVTLQLTNTQDIAFSGPVTLSVYASTDGTVSTSAIQLTQLSYANLGLRAFGSKNIKVKFDYPAGTTAGNYFLVASFTATSAGTAASISSSSAAIVLQTPTADLAVSFASGALITLKETGTDSAILVITNEGNVTATGTFVLTLDGATDASGTGVEPLATYSSKRISLKAGRSTKFKLKFAAPTSDSDLVATIAPSTTPADSNASDDQAEAAIFFS